MNGFLASVSEYANASYGILPFGIGFVLGLLVGYSLGRFLRNNNMKHWERSVITLAVLLVWVISVFADILVDSYSTPTAVHAIMGIVAGYFFEGNLVDVFKKKEE